MTNDVASLSKRVQRQKLAIFGLVVALVFTLAGYGIASAGVLNGNGTINACYKAKNGNLRVSVTACKASEKSITLGGSGATIVAGYNGGAVILATDGSQTPVGVLTIPTGGSYAVSATLTLALQSGSSSIARCYLGSDAGAVITPGPGEGVPLTLTSVATVSAGSTITLSCSAPPSIGATAALDISMTAIPGTGLINGTLPS